MQRSRGPAKHNGKGTCESEHDPPPDTVDDAAIAAVVTAKPAGALLCRPCTGLDAYLALGYTVIVAPFVPTEPSPVLASSVFLYDSTPVSTKCSKLTSCSRVCTPL